jgi:hypothetical protein
MLSQQYWLSLSRETRERIAILLEIPKSTGVTVQGGVVISDGYTYQDLATVTLEKLQLFMNEAEPDFYKLFGKLVHNVELPPIDLKPQEELLEEEVVELTEEEKKTKLEALQAEVDGLKKESRTLYPRTQKTKVMPSAVSNENKTNKAVKPSNKR